MLEVSFIRPIAFVGDLTTTCLLPMSIADDVAYDVTVLHAPHDCYSRFQCESCAVYRPSHDFLFRRL